MASRLILFVLWPKIDVTFRRFVATCTCRSGTSVSCPLPISNFFYFPYDLRYVIGLGFNRGKDDIRPFQSVTATVRSFTFSGLDSSSFHGKFLYVTVEAINSLAMSSMVTLVIRSGQSGSSSLVHGTNISQNANVQASTTAMLASWRPEGCCPQSNAMWEVVDLWRSEAIQSLTNVSKMENGSCGPVTLSNKNLHLLNGKTYRVIVRGYDAWGRLVQQMSRGTAVTASYTLKPGQVFDGPYNATDVNYQESTTQLSASWHSFGDKHHPSGKVARYEVAMGTDRRYAATRTNILAFQDMGLNTSCLIKNLQLKQNIRYYTTVRAYSVSGAFSEVTSNGVFAGYSPQISVGSVTVAAFQANTSVMNAHWEGFQSPHGVIKYEWAIGTRKLTKDDLNMACNTSTSFFDVLAFRDVGLDTSAKVDGMSLQAGSTYYVTVRTTDSAQDCAAAQSISGVIIDNTPPKPGFVVVGYDSRSPTSQRPGQWFSSASNVINVTWENFSDGESGIDLYEVTLYRQSRCGDHTTNVQQRHVSAGLVTTYKFEGEKLTEDTAYVVRVSAVNKAGLSTSATSSPFLVDTTQPVPGQVHDGENWNIDMSFQNSSTDVWATFTHLPNSTTYQQPCPRGQMYSFQSNHTGWTVPTGR